MKIKAPEIEINATSIETMLWHIERELMERHVCDAAARYMIPLKWYVNTGRAPTSFLRALMNGRPVLIARDLAKGGSDEEVIDRICKRIGFKREN